MEDEENPQHDNTGKHEQGARRFTQDAESASQQQQPGKNKCRGQEGLPGPPSQPWSDQHPEGDQSARQDERWTGEHQQSEAWWRPDHLGNVESEWAKEEERHGAGHDRDRVNEPIR